MSVDGKKINATMKTVLRLGGFTSPANGMPPKDLVRGVFDSLRNETDQEECVDDAVRDLLQRHRDLFKVRGRAAIQKVDGRQLYWFNDPQKSDDPPTDGFICALSTAAREAMASRGAPVAVSAEAEFVAPPTPVPPPTSGFEVLVGNLAELHDLEILTDEQFVVATKKLLARTRPTLG
jgi:hypothetical protein